MPSVSALRPCLVFVSSCSLLAGLPFLGACQSRQPVAAAVAPAPMAIPPEGPGCGAAIARTRAVVESDVATGNLDPPVGARFGADLSRAQSSCAAGREGEALGLLASAKARYGYR